MSPFVFDQISGDEEAIDAAMDRIRKQRKRTKAILQVASLVHTLNLTYSLQDPESDEYDLWNEDNDDPDGEDEIYND